MERGERIGMYGLFRNYVVEDGDVIFFKFNAGAGLTAGGKKK